MIEFDITCDGCHCYLHDGELLCKRCREKELKKEIEIKKNRKIRNLEDTVSKLRDRVEELEEQKENNRIEIRCEGITL